MLTGVMIVRTMDKNEFGYYTLANTMQSTVGVLADIGVISSMLSIGGRVWQDRTLLGELINTGLNFRRQVGIGGLVCITPLSFYLLISHGANPFYALLISLLIAGGLNFQLSNDVLIIVPRLHSRIKTLQRVELSTATIRFLLIAVACLLWVNTAVAIAMTVAAFAIQNISLRKWAATDADLSAPVSKEIRISIWRTVRQQAPNAIYYCLQGQLVVLLIATFGSVQRIAEVGALSRLAAIYSVINSVITGIVLPWYARCSDMRQLRKAYLGIVGIFVMVGAIFLVLSMTIPDVFLWLLGSKYAHLQSELAFIVLSTVVASVQGVLYALNSSRGWVEYAWLTIPLTIVSQLLLLPFLNLTTVKGVVLLNTLPMFVTMIPYMYRAFSGFQGKTVK